MKKMFSVSIAGLAMTAAVGLAAARTQSANLGTARIGAQANLFNYSFSSGAVFALGNADWASGLVLDSFGAKAVRIAARATAPGAFVRLVASDFFGNVTMATAFQALPLVPAPIPLLFGINVVANGTIVIDAIMNNGALLGTADYNP